MREPYWLWSIFFLRPINYTACVTFSTKLCLHKPANPEFTYNKPSKCVLQRKTIIFLLVNTICLLTRSSGYSNVCKEDLSGDLFPFPPPPRVLGKRGYRPTAVTVNGKNYVLTIKNANRTKMPKRKSRGLPFHPLPSVTHSRLPLPEVNAVNSLESIFPGFLYLHIHICTYKSMPTYTFIFR